MNRREFLKLGGVFAGAALLPREGRREQNESLLPHQVIKFRAVQIGDNVSALKANIPQPSVDDDNEGKVLRIGGKTGEGDALGVLLMGRKAPDEVTLAMAVPAGNSEQGFQGSTCSNGKIGENDKDQLNDRFSLMLVPESVVKDGITIEAADDDENNGVAGQIRKYGIEELRAAPMVEFVAIRVPEQMDGKVSLVESELGDAWQAEFGNKLGNNTVVFVGHKDGATRGVAVENNGVDRQSAQVPAVCSEIGSEWANDPSGNKYLLVTKGQVFSAGVNRVKLSENDLEGQAPGETVTVDLGLYAQAFMSRVYLPMIGK